MISARMRRMADCRGVRIHRCRCSIKNSTPCSLSVMGKGSSSFTRCNTSTSSTSSSKPPGARLSALTLPVTITLDSWVRPRTRSKTSGVTAALGTMPCTVPVPSRKMGKSSFPLARRLYSHPCSVTRFPSCWLRVAMVARGASAATGKVSCLISSAISRSRWNVVVLEESLQLEHFESLGRAAGDVLRRILGQVIDLQHRGGQLRSGAQLLHGLRPDNRSLPGPKMLILLSMVVMDMGATDQRFQLGDGCGNARADVGMTQVQAYPNIFKVADAHNLHQVGGLADLVLDVFEQELYAQRSGKGLQVFDGCHG